VCFAGVGPGEVLADDGAKLVGISQRRTRNWALFQCAVPLKWDAAPLIAVLGPSAEPAAAAKVHVLPPETAATAVSALAALLG
jgi:lipoate-protein ligase A